MPRRKKETPEQRELRELRESFLGDGSVPPPPSLGELLEAHEADAARNDLRARALDDFFVFAVEVCGDVGLDAAFHGTIARFLEAGERAPFPPAAAHHAARARAELDPAGQLPRALPPPPGTRPYAVELDGTFRGMYVALRGGGRLKQLLCPRGHVKTGLLEDFVLWLQVRSVLSTGKPVRVALACERQQLACDILHGIRRKVEKSRTFQATFPEVVPECFLTGSAPRPKDLTWEKAAVELPGSHLMHEREPSISCYGAETGITGCHFDYIFFDDIVTPKNIGTDARIQKVRQFVEDAIFLLDPSGKVLDVGTRWHFADAHGAILDGSLLGLDAVSLCFATIDGDDGDPLYPFADRRGRKYGFTRAGIDQLIHGDAAKNVQPISPERFASQYRNQPIEAKDSLFPRDAWGFFDLQDHLAEIAKRPSTRWGLCDPAIKKYPGQQTGDFAFVCVLDCLASGEWRVLDARRGRWTVDELLDALQDLNARWSPITLGIEAGQYENTLQYAAAARGLALPIQAIKSPMNRQSKEMRCLRITGKQRAGHIKLPGDPSKKLKAQYWDLPEWVRVLIEEAARFPKGAFDDCIDTLGYGPDVVIAPLVDEVAGPTDLAPTTAADVLANLGAESPAVHPVLGGVR